MINIIRSVVIVVIIIIYIHIYIYIYVIYVLLLDARGPPARGFGGLCAQPALRLPEIGNSKKYIPYIKMLSISLYYLSLYTIL